MRLLILSLMILMLPIEMSAEKDYSVFLIKGKIDLRNGKNVSRLKEKQQLSENDTIAVKEGSCLVLRSVSEKRHTITIKTSFYGPIKRISDGKTSGVTKKITIKGVYGLYFQTVGVRLQKRRVIYERHGYDSPRCDTVSEYKHHDGSS